MASNYIRRAMLVLVCFFVLACVVIMSFGEREHRGQVYGGGVGNAGDRTVIASLLLRRGMVDAASHRFERAMRAFDAARRAAADNADLLALINAEAAKLEPVSRKGDVR